MPQHRSSQTGRKVSSKFAKDNPDVTIKESKSRDTKRLDWLQKNGATVYPGRGEWCVYLGGLDDRGKSLRDAIDAAMKAHQ